MGSVAQIGLGIIILGAAFIFGHYVNEEAAKKTEATVVEEVEPSNELVWSQPAEIQTLKQRMELARSNSIELPALNSENALVANNQLDTHSNYQPPVKEAPPASISPVLEEAPPLLKIEPLEQTSTDLDFVQPDFSGLASLDQSLPNELADNRPWQVEGTAAEKEELFAPPLGSIADNESPDFERLQHAKDRTKTQSKSMQIEPARDSATMPDQHVANRIPLPSGNSNLPTESNNYYRPNYSRLQSDQGHTKVVTEKAQSRMARVSSRRATELRLDTNEFARYETRSGDTLQSLAKKFYGKSDFYLDIYLANQDVLRSPASLPVGIVLKIPKYQ